MRIVYIFLAPIAWKIGDAFRKFAHPDIYFANGALDLAEKKLFWLFGPQLISCGIAFWLLFVSMTKLFGNHIGGQSIF